MDSEIMKVYSSTIIRAQNENKNNLNEILEVIPAKPILHTISKQNICDYKPKGDKYYIPKKKSGLKVETVRSIRNIFEKDVYSQLIDELEKQQSILLEKIRLGSSRDNNTKQIAKDMLNSGTPVSKSVWHMLRSINPDEHSYPFQYVYWNGTYIQVNGSKGSKNKLINKYDVGKIFNKSDKNIHTLKNNFKIKRKSLLQQSLNVNFMPGPLAKKKLLDMSYQKYQLGNTELVDLPTPTLEIETGHGLLLEPTIAKFLHQTFMPDSNGTMSEKWVEFAVSGLGNNENKTYSQSNNKSIVTFKLDYKCSQNRILMRRTNDMLDKRDFVSDTITRDNDISEEDCDILFETKRVVNDILNAVTISVDFEDKYKEDEPRVDATPNNSPNVYAQKDKSKKRYCELDRLDVTVIRIAETSKNLNVPSCQKDYCRFGCICSSLRCDYNVRTHCGQVECMFHCNCDFSSVQLIDGVENEYLNILPGLANIDKRNNVKLAKEEQKFHQTVIVTDEKSILLKSRKRNWKSSKKYEDFFTHMRLKPDDNIKKEVSVVALKLDCSNIEPWCMVHNLYRCFCKGRLLNTTVKDMLTHDNDNSSLLPVISLSSETSKENKNVEINTQETRCLNHLNLSRLRQNITSVQQSFVQESVLNSSETSSVSSQNSKENKNVERNTPKTRYLNTNNHLSLSRLRRRITSVQQSFVQESVLNSTEISSLSSQNSKENKNVERNTPKTRYLNTNNHQNLSRLRRRITSVSQSVVQESVLNSIETSNISKKSQNVDTCARVNLYQGRKYNDEYYYMTHKKIREMEKNDKKMHSKMMNHIPQNDVTDSNDSQDFVFANNSYSESCLKELLSSVIEENSQCSVTQQSPVKRLSLNDTASNNKKLAYKAKIISWIEYNYKQYKFKNEQGNSKVLLDAPKAGNVKLYPWNFILSRYRERKNFFLVSKQKPFRIFMAIDIKNSLFETCINIGDISWSDLDSYPITVKYLLTNATDLIDNFCILYGLSHCWELIGSVSKVNEKKSDKLKLTEYKSPNKDSTAGESVSPCLQLPVTPEKTQNNIFNIFPAHKTGESSSEYSKWFLMTIENDFTEIQFLQKGFFVTYDSIMKAINVARTSGNTVRLSSQKYNDQQKNPQFGIYAIPNSIEFSVFIGPYEKDETLGIETLKTATPTGKNCTRGLWITINKNDNIKVVDNPLSFMPSTSMRNKKMIPLGSDTFSIINCGSPESSTSDQRVKCKERNKVKPIKIRKTNGFYHLASNGVFQQISQANVTISNVKNIKPVVTKGSILKIPDDTVGEQGSLQKSLEKKSYNENSLFKSKKPVAEIAPQVNTYRSSIHKNLSKSNNEGGMFILKPEEINKRLGESIITCTSKSPERQTNTTKADIENFLATSYVRPVPKNIYVVSGDNDNTKTKDCNDEVYIVCQNVENLGWIAGKQNAEQHLSFQFPGFNETKFYSEEEAFLKINQ